MCTTKIQNAREREGRQRRLGAHSHTRLASVGRHRGRWCSERGVEHTRRAYGRDKRLEASRTSTLACVNEHAFYFITSKRER